MLCAHSNCPDSVQFTVPMVRKLKQIFTKLAYTQDQIRGYKTFFMFNSFEHEILIAQIYENINKFSIFQAQISLECYFSCS